MTRSVGIDIGAHSIKIAELEIGPKRREILGLYEINIEEGQSVSQLLEEYFKNNAFMESERLSVGLGNTPVIVRHLHFPYSDKNKVKTAVEFEFEDKFPLNIEEQIIDFRFVRKIGRMYEFIAGMAPSDHVKTLNDIFEQCKLIPHAYYYDTEALSQLALSQTLPGSESGEPYGIIDFGYEATKISILRGRRPKIFDPSSKIKDNDAEILEMRSIPRGIKDLIEWIAEEKQMSTQEAKQWLEHRAVIKESTQIEEASLSDEMSDELKTALRPVLVELYQTLQALRGRLSININTLYVTGGGSLIRGFKSFMSHELRVTVYEWDILADFNLDKVSVSQNKKATFGLAVALAHRYCYTKPSGWLNFRKSAQAMRRPLSKMLEYFQHEEFKWTLNFAGIVLAVLYVHYFVGNYFYSTHEDYLKKELTQTLQKFDPESSFGVGRVVGDPDKAREFFEKIKKNKGLEEKPKIPRSKSEVFLDLSETLPLNAVASELQVNNTSSEALIWRMKVKNKSGPGKWDLKKFSAQLKPLLESKGYEKITIKGTGADQALVSGVWTGANL